MKKCYFVGSNDIHDKDELFEMLVGRIEYLIENGDVGEFWVEDCNCFDEICISALRHVKEKNKLMPIARIFLHKYPNMVKSMADRHFRYNDTISYIEGREKEGKVLVIRPPEALNIGSMETRTEEIDRVYGIGRETGLKYVELIKEFLKKDTFAGNKLS